MQLIERADVLVSRLFPDEAESQNLNYESVVRLNPNIIYCSVTPFGDEGPFRNKRAGELEVQGMSGQWRLIGTFGEPPIRVGVPIGAMYSAVFSVQGIVAALIHRMRTGEGQKVSVSNMGAILSMCTITWAAESEPDDWIGHCVTPNRPPARGFRAKDRAMLWAFHGDNDGEEKFLEEIGLKGMEFGTWNSPELKVIFEDAVKDMTADEVISLVRKHGGTAVPYHTFETLSRDPQADAMNMLPVFDHPVGGEIKTVGIPWEFSETSPAVGTPPLLGQHTRDVLMEIGYGATDISKLERSGAILYNPVSTPSSSYDKKLQGSVKRRTK